jgi:serine/threonine protein kinase/GTPase SAR1 family protein
MVCPPQCENSRRSACRKLKMIREVCSAEREVDLSAETLPAKLGSTVARVIKRCSGLRDVGPLLICFNPKHHITSLDLCENSIDAEGLRDLVTSKQLVNSLETLLFRGNKLGDEGAHLIGCMLRESKHLSCLHLAKNGITHNGCRAFAKGLQGNSSLSELVLAQNAGIGDAGVEALKGSFMVHPLLNKLDLSSCNLGQKAARVLSDVLVSARCNLETLLLSANPNIGSEGAHAIAYGLSNNSSLHVIDLAYCQVNQMERAQKLNVLGGAEIDNATIVSSGAASIANGLARNRTLTRLDLSGNWIGKNGIKVFGEMLKVNSSLSHLFVSLDQPSDLFCEALRSNTSLTEVFAPLDGTRAAFKVGAELKKNRDRIECLHVALTQGKGLDMINGTDLVNGRTSVWHSALLRDGGNLEVIRELLKFPVAVGQLMKCSSGGQSALEVIAAVSSKEILREVAPFAIPLLCRAGDSKSLAVFLKASSSKPTSAILSLASELGHADVVKLLIAKEAHLSGLVNGLTSLHLAAVNGHSDVCIALLDSCPELLNVLTPSGNSVLAIASKAGRVEVVKLLLERGAIADSLSLALAGNVEVCKLLLKGGASASEAGAARSLKERNLDVVTELLDAGASRSLLEEVTALDLRFLFRDSLPSWIGNCPNLKLLKCCEGNSLRLLPPSVVGGGDEAVLNFLRDIGGSEKDVWNSVKVMVLGKEGVGKTHILHLLSEKNYLRNESTDGIDVRRFRISETDQDVVWFDFGGQEIFYATHQLFLTGSAVYLLVFNAQEECPLDRLTYWLHCVESFASDPSRPARAVIVGTHTDGMEPTKLEEVRVELQRLAANRSSIVAHCFVSCIENPDELRTTIARGIRIAASSARLIERQIPRSYLRIAETLHSLNLQKKQLSWDECVSLFPGYDKFMLERAFSFLHDAGELFFKKGIVFLDVAFLAKLFSTLITFKHSWIKNGIVRHEEMCHIWKSEYNFTPAEISAVMSIFERFDLIFAKRAENIWVVPCLLEDEEPPAVATFRSMRKVAQERVFELDVLPAGVFGRLLAHIQEWSNVEKKWTWRKGFVAMDSVSTVVVFVNGSKIHLRLLVAAVQLKGRGRGRELNKDSRSLFRRVCEELQLILQQLFSRAWVMPVRQFIACPHCLALSVPSPVLLSYEDCISHLLSGWKEFQCGSLKFPIARLGYDLSFDYVRVFADEELQVESKPFAEGSFGQICQGVIKDGNIRVASKALKYSAGVEGGLDGFREFQREVSVMSTLEHPNIVSIYGIAFGPLRMILELCVEGDLMGCLRKGVLQNNASLIQRIALDIAKGMSFLHGQQPPMAHRDLRSPNVFLVYLDATKLCAKVADFGMTMSCSARLTNPLLTWQWMAPEAYAGESYDESCDIYSFGIILWELCDGQGKVPFQDHGDKNLTVQQVITMVMSGSVRLSFPKECLVPVLQKLGPRCWSLRPSSRPSFESCVAVFEGRPEVRWKPGGMRSDLAGTVLKKIMPSLGSVATCGVYEKGQLWLGHSGGELSCDGKQYSQHDAAVSCICCPVGQQTLWSAAEDGSIAVLTLNQTHPLKSSSVSKKESRPASKKSLPLRLKISSRKSSDEIPLSNSPGSFKVLKSPRLFGRLSKETVPSASEGRSRGVLCGLASGLLLAGDLSGSLLMYESSPDKISAKLNLGGPIVGIVALSPTSCWVLAGGEFHHVDVLYRVDIGQAEVSSRVAVALPHENEEISCFVGGGGALVWSAGTSIKLWNAASRKCLLTIDDRVDGALTALAIVNLKGRSVVFSGSRSGNVKIWDPHSGRLIGTINGDSTVGAVLFMLETGEDTVVVGYSNCMMECSFVGK